MIETMQMNKLQDYRATKASKSQNVFERINSVCDEASFVQSLSYLGATGDAQSIQNTIVCGFGKINGQNIGVVAQNYQDSKGSVDVVSINKAIATVEKATKSGMPVVFILDSAGMNLDLGVAAMDAYSKLLQTVVRSSGVVPMLGVVAGPCVGVQGMLAESLDFIIVAGEKAQLGAYSQFVLDSAGKFDKEKALRNLGVQFVTETEEEAFDKVKELLSYLPANNLQKPFVMETIENNANDNYKDVEELINGVFDADSVLRLYENTKVFLGFARLQGQTVAVVSTSETKGLCIGCCNKIARFVQTANCFNIPVITFADNNGIVLDTTQEEAGVLRAATRLAFAYGQAVVPMISVIVGKAVGTGYVILSSKGIGNDFVFAMPNAVISPLDLDAAIRVNYQDRMTGVDNIDEVKEELKKEYIENIASPFEVVKQGVIDDILLPSELREKLAQSLAVIRTKRDSFMPKKHSNMPL